MASLNNLNQLRSVGNFATTYLWDIRFYNTSISGNQNLIVGNAAFPFPFNNWFPASSVEEPIFQIETLPIKAHVLETEIPKASGGRQVTVECYDDAGHTIERSLQQWFEEMFPKYGSVSPLLDVLKILEVSRLSPKKEVIYTNRYYVFPKGNLNVGGNSQSAAKKLNFTLAVAGMETVLF
jgi:hypothetical protein